MFNLTPETFVDLLILGLYWEHWPPKTHLSVKGNEFTRAGFSTVDHVLKIARNLEVVSPEQIKLVQDKRLGIVHQRKLYRHCAIAYGSTYATDRYSLLLCQRSGTRNSVSMPKLVRDQRLGILPSAVALAPSLETKYAEILDKEAYLAEATRVNETFKTEAASATAIKRYRQSTARALEGDK